MELRTARRIGWDVMDTSYGPMLVAGSDKGICYLSFGEGEAELRTHFPAAKLVKAGAECASLFETVLDAIENPGASHDIPLDVQGTAFQKRVWQALRDIPAGLTRSYGELADELGDRKATRAVGTANGANKIAILIPCHRVIAADGGLGGYAYGLDMKAELLRREGALMV